jgi:hypothetical protein
MWGMAHADRRAAGRALAVLGISAVIGLTRAAPADAQAVPATGVRTRAASTPVSPTPTHRWEIEGYGGFVPASVTPFGSSHLPVPGASIQTASALFPSRHAPSWLFGDGASLFNGAGAELGVSTGIAPLDAALTSRGLGGRNPTGGVRVRRTMTPRYSLEVSVDVSRGSSSFSPAFVSAIDAARDSFRSAFTGLLATGPFTGVVVAATDARTNGSGADISVTGAMSVNLRPRGAVVPYATLGAGVMTRSGRLPSATVEGDYRFSVLNAASIHETDRVTIGFTRGSAAAPLAVFGGGLRHDVSERWGWRIDARALAGGGIRVRLDATPSIAIGTPAGSVESLTNPNIQFSNNPSTGRVSTLGGPALQRFVAFDGGVGMRFALTVGIFRRF